MNIRLFEGNKVQFNMKDYFNSTLIAKKYGKRGAAKWLETSKTKKFLRNVAEQLKLEQDQLYVVRVGAPSTGGGTWLHLSLKNNFEEWCLSKISVEIPELYVVLFNTGVLKVGKANKGFSRVKSHISQAQCFGVKTLQFFIEKNPTITEEELIEFCNQNGTLHHGNEYFKNLNYDKVVNFLKRKIERKVLRLVRSNNG